jgi:hypothetical protein
MLARYRILSLLFGALLFSACNHSKSSTGFAIIDADRQITGPSAYPLAVDLNRVGGYTPDAKSGAGYFYDDVLEYRVWLHPENGAKPLNGSNDYFVAFAQYETAERFSKRTPGAEEPLVLVRQQEWIDEPERGHFIPMKEERTTEWQVRWLPNGKRTPKSIEEFMKHPREAGPP